MTRIAALVFACFVTIVGGGAPALAAPLRIIYPPAVYRTDSASIFFIGAAPPAGDLRLDGRAVPLNRQGYFAASAPLKPGVNTFYWVYRDKKGTLQSQQQQVTRRVEPPLARDRPVLAVRSPLVDQQVPALAPVCLEAQATPGGRVLAELAGKSLMLSELPPFRPVEDSAAILSGAAGGELVSGIYRGCLAADPAWREQVPRFELRWQGQNLSAQAPAAITTLDPRQIVVVEVVPVEAIVRAGPGAGYARLAPLTQGVRSQVIAQSGDWYRLQGEGWIQKSDLRILPAGTPLPKSAVGSLRTRTSATGSELLIPLETRLPTSVRQEETRLVVSLWGAVAATDLIRFESTDPLIRSVQWEPITPQGMRFYIDLRSSRQWGYQLRYEGNVLVIALRRPPRVSRALAGLTVMLDPGHGGNDTGSTGCSGVQEKTVNLQIALRLRNQLQRAGATVLMTRTGDRTVSLARRVELMRATQPTVYLSLHNNALPDAGDPLRQHGTSVYWYQMQSRNLAEALHRQLIGDLGQPDYGLFWDSLAVIRPTEAPAVLLEFGFMTHPDEYARLLSPAFQERIARSLARGLTSWLHAAG